MTSPSSTESPRRRLLGLVITVLVAALVVAWFALLSPLPAVGVSVAPCVQDRACVRDDDDAMSALPAGWNAATSGSTPVVGVVLYTGARVDPLAYAPIAERVAERGYPVWVPHLRFNLAVIDQDAADVVIADHPEVDRWIVAGHSLGGAMAARYVASHDTVSGLALLGAYPEEDLDLRSSGLMVVAVYGSEDGLSSPAEVTGAASQLPPDTSFVEVVGGNHAQFGSYGPQRGDNPATISALAQWDQVASAIADEATALGSAPSP